MDLNAAVFARKIEDETHVRGPERVESLVVVADRPELHARGHKTVDELHLSGIDVLIFIDEHMVIHASRGGRIARISFHGADQQRHDVGEVDGAGVAERDLVNAEEFHGPAEHFIVGVDRGRKARRIEQAFLGAADDIQDIGVLVPPHLARAEDVALLRRVPKLKTLGKPGSLRITAQMPEREAVEGCDAEIGGGRNAEGRRDAGFHFVRRFPGEGQSKDAPAVDASVHQMDETRRKRRGLARAGAGENELNASGRGGGPLLRRIEGVDRPAIALPRHARTQRVEDARNTRWCRGHPRLSSTGRKEDVDGRDNPRT
jgi:hypothetical protein